MFGFLNSMMLFAAVAALIPLLIHLFSKRKMKTVMFSSLERLTEMRRRQVRRIKIRQLLLLALRMLIILMAVAAFARPVTQSGYLGSHAGVSAVILVDVSASMSRETNDGTIFELAIERTMEILETYGEADEIILAPFASDIDISASEGFGSAARAISRLNELSCGAGRSDLNLALEKSLTLFDEASHFNRELVVVSDFQRNALDDSAGFSAIRVNDNSSGDIKIFAVELGNDYRSVNTGITDIDFGGQLIEVGADFSIGYTVRNYDRMAKTNIIASLYIDNNRVAQSNFSLGPNESERKNFVRKIGSAGIHTARIELSSDDYLADNSFHFVFEIPEIFNALIIDDNAGGEFIRIALNPTDQGSRHWRVKTISAELFGSINLRDYDVLILAGVDQLAKTSLQRLNRFARRGGGILVIPGENISTSGFASSYSELTGLILSKEMRINAPGSGFFVIDEIDFSHPIFQVFEELYSEEIPTFRFFSIPKFQTTTEVNVLARFSGGHPSLTERKIGRGKVLTFGGILTPQFTDLPSHSFFVPFVIRLCEYLGSDLSNYDYRRKVGANATTALSSRVNPNEILTLISPSGDYTYVSATESGSEYIVTLGPFEETGIYTLRSLSGIVDQYAVNVDSHEGDFIGLDISRIENVVPYEIETMSEGVSAASFLTEKRVGSELWKPLLWLVALALLAEAALAGEFGKRSVENDD
ncbi:MAG: BatA domain-containing protein [candidate division Zixibacteria bacterium]|nr:BatA domain-containing protein [candidate division Zixibacteria bacterium]